MLHLCTPVLLIWLISSASWRTNGPETCGAGRQLSANTKRLIVLHRANNMRVDPSALVYLARRPLVLVALFGLLSAEELLGRDRAADGQPKQQRECMHSLIHSHTLTYYLSFSPSLSHPSSLIPHILPFLRVISFYVRLVQPQTTGWYKQADGELVL